MAAKEEDIVKRYERVKRDDAKPMDRISSNDGIEENSKFLDQFKENEIKDQVADSTEKKEATITTEKKENKTKIGTKLTNIKNIVTHEDIEGHRSVLSEALLHQLHGPNEKVIFLSSGSEEDAKLEHIPSFIDPGHTHGQQVVLLPKATEETIPANYHLQQIGDKITLVPSTTEEKLHKLQLLPQSIETGLHHLHHPSGKVLVIRKAQEDVLTNLHSHLHSPSQKVVLFPKTRDESILSLLEHGAGHQKVFLLPKDHEESIDHSHSHSHVHHAPHHHQKYVILPKGHEETFGGHFVSRSLGGHSLDGHSISSHMLGGHTQGGHSLGGHAISGHSLGGHTVSSHPLGAHTLLGHSSGLHPLGTHTVGSHVLGAHPSITHSLAQTLGNNYHIQTQGDKIILLPKLSDETVSAINQVSAQSQGLVLLNQAEERQAKMHYLPSVFANNEVAYKTYGGGYTLPVSSSVLSNINVEQGKVPVVISNMLGFNPAIPHNLVSHLHKNLQQQLSKTVLPQLVKHVKLAEHQVDKNKHEIDLGAAIHHHFTIVKKVGVPYLKPFPYQIERRIPYPFVQQVPVLVDRPYKVHVVKPYPVVSPYLKSSDGQVKFPLGYPASFKGQVLLNVPKSSKPDQISKSILIHKSEPVLVKHE